MAELESDFDSSLVVVVLATFYPKWYRGKLRSIKHTDKIRGDLALELIQTAKNLGYQVVVSDASSRTFRSSLSAIDGIKIIKRRSKGQSEGRRKAIEVVSKMPVKVIILTEPEKLSFVKNCIPLIVKPILDSNADIVVPKREEKLFKQTYPYYQYESETEANSLYNENLRSYKILDTKDEDLDFFFGPRAFKNDKKIISLFMKKFTIAVDNFSLPKDYFDPEEYSNVLFFSIVSALKKKLKVKGVEVPFTYPTIQKENEENLREIFIEKRKSQRLGPLIELMHFLFYIEKNPEAD